MSDPVIQKSSYPGGNIEQIVATLVAWGDRRDLGRLSALRAWWQPSKYYIAAPVLGSLLGGARMNDKALACVAASFASHRLHLDKKGFNFGASCRLLADKPLEDKDPFASHFRRVLACDEDGIDDLSQVLRRLIQRLDGKPINYVQLSYDLLVWQKSSEGARRIKTRWAEEYYRAHADDEEGAADQPTPP